MDGTTSVRDIFLRDPGNSVRIHGDENIMFLSFYPCVHVLLAVQAFLANLIEKKNMNNITLVVPFFSFCYWAAVANTNSGQNGMSWISALEM